jgi:hypothetical protein
MSSMVDRNLLKAYQIEAIEKWKQIGEVQGKSTLSYFETNDQSGREMVIDLQNNFAENT